MNSRGDEFDDPSLQAALRRAVAGQPAAAPPSLRLRVEALFESAAPIAIAEGARSAAGRRWPRWAGESRGKTFAAAAAALIAVVIAGLQIWAYMGPDDSGRASQPVVFPVSLATEMVIAHDNFAKLADQSSPAAAAKDPAVLAEQLSKTESRPVALIKPDAGWQFKGGGTTKVGGAQAAYLLYSKGNQTVSVFSMPAPRSCRQGMSPPYRETMNGHPVAGFVFGGAVYGVVGSQAGGAEMPLSDLAPLAEQVESCVGAGGCESLSASTHPAP